MTPTALRHCQGDQGEGDHRGPGAVCTHPGGYTFAGWYSDEALTQKVTSVKLNGNTTVYAKWTENAVTPTLPFTDVKSGDWSMRQSSTSTTRA